MAPIPLEKLLNSTTGGALGELVQRAEGMGRLLAGLKQGLDPELAARLKGVNLRPDGQLVIIAETPAWAARLRFESDALIEAARRCGVEASSCKVIVAKEPPAKPGKDEREAGPPTPGC